MKEYKSLLEVLKVFPTENSCIEHLEKLRWPKGVVCPCCGSSRKIYKVSRSNIYKCADCNKQFSVRKGTIFEESRLPLTKWFAAAWLITNHRKGISSCQLAREIGITQKTAWFMLGRLRDVAEGMGATGGPLSNAVEADETYLGGKEKNKHRNKKVHIGRGPAGKQAVAGLRERSGRIKIKMVTTTEKDELHRFIMENVTTGSTLYTDDHRSYLGIKKRNYDHHSVNHSVGEYVRGKAHTNGIESFWALLKRGYYGTFHHLSWKHLKRYLSEFEARFNMDKMNSCERMNYLLESVSGRRLSYRGLIA